MDGDFFDPCPDPEADKEQYHCPAEHSNIGINFVVPKPCNSQEPSDTGGEVDAFSKGFARIAVDVGQHSGKTAQTGSDKAGSRINAKTVGGSSDDDASGGAASDVLLKVAQTRYIPFEGMPRKYR